MHDVQVRVRFYDRGTLHILTFGHPYTVRYLTSEKQATCVKVIFLRIADHNYGGRAKFSFNFRFPSDNQQNIRERNVKFCMKVDHKYVSPLCIIYQLYDSNYKHGNDVNLVVISA